MHKTGLLLAAIMTMLLCGCDGELWISSGDDGWTSDFDQSGAPANSAASTEGQTSTGSTSGNKKKTSAPKNSTSDNTAAKTDNLELIIGVPETAHTGKNFTCSLTVKNSTAAELKNLVIEGMLPASLKLTDASGQIAMRWKIPSIVAGESKSFSATLQPSAEGSYVLKARVFAENGKNTSATATVKVTKEEPKKQS